ncbi:MAG: phosphoserine phosphatase SerB, partial [Burkholderiaceae bacterium]
MDLVIQGPALSPEAIDTFKVVCSPARITRRTAPEPAARLLAVTDDAETRKAVAGLADFWKLDFAFVSPSLKLADFRLLAMDMDSTLINIESLDEIAAYAGRGEEVAAITEAAMRGEITDYAESLRRRVAMLAGVDAALIERVYEDKLRLNPGAEDLIRAAQAAGLKTLLVTGGFTEFTAKMKTRLGLDFTRSNELKIIDGKLTGGVSGPNDGAIIDAAGKARTVAETCQAIACPTSAAITMGDGANDLAMMKLAGLSVAYRAKPVVRAQATYALSHASLAGVLNWFTDEPELVSQSSNKDSW